MEQEFYPDEEWREVRHVTGRLRNGRPCNALLFKIWGESIELRCPRCGQDVQWNVRTLQAQVEEGPNNLTHAEGYQRRSGHGQQRPIRCNKMLAEIGQRGISIRCRKCGEDAIFGWRELLPGLPPILTVRPRS